MGAYVHVEMKMGQKLIAMGHHELSRRWLELNNDEYRHIPELGQGGTWMRWIDGSGWENGGDAALISISTVSEHVWRDKKGKHDAVVAGSHATAAGGLKFAAAKRCVPLCLWNANPLLLGLSGLAVMDLKTGETRDAVRDDYLTKSTPALPVEEGLEGSPVDAFLQEKLPDPEVREWMGRWCGYCMTGLTREQTAVWIVGDTSTGKSTLVAMLHALMGGYAFTLSNDLFKADSLTRGNEKGYALARAPGMRVVTFSEWEKDWKLDEAFFTAITGCDTVMVRQVRAKPFDLKPSFKLTVAANHLPAGRVSPQVLRRLVPIPMDVSHEHEPDVFRVEQLTSPANLGHFAAWCLAGYRRYLKVGLRPLPIVSQSMLQDLARKGADPDGDDKALLERFEMHYAAGGSGDCLPTKVVNETMLYGASPSSKAGRKVTRWLRGTLAVKTVRGVEHYVGITVNQ